MILVEQESHRHLVRVLSRLKADPGTMRCLYFNFSGDPMRAPKAHMATTPTIIVDLLNKHSASLEHQIFAYDDGDIFILAADITGYDAQALAADVALRLGPEASYHFVQFYRLDIQFEAVFNLALSKLQQMQKAIETAQEKKAQQQAAQKKDQILNPPVPYNQTSSIAERRCGRAVPACMLIEDDVFSRRLVEKVLHKDFHLTTIPGAENALITYIAVAPNILFLDIGLPEINGHELLQRVMQIDPEAYVIMISGNADMPNVKRAMKMGARGFIAKPFTREKILQYIKRCPTIHSYQS